MLWEPQKPNRLDVLECYEVLYGLANTFHVESYLEVGVREGASLICVLAKEQEVVRFATKCLSSGIAYVTPQVVSRVKELFTLRNPDIQVHLFDNWCYVGCKEGHRRVEELVKQGFGLHNVNFYDGDSKDTLPKFTGMVDLAFVDGDHTVEGARRDLENVVSHAKIIVFHDLYHSEWEGLEKEFIQFCRRHSLPYVIVGRRALGTGVAFNIW